MQFQDSSGGGTITLNGVRWMTKAEGPLGGAPTHGAYLVADVSLKATAGTITPNPLAFKVTAPDGTTYNSELGVLNNQVPSDDVAAGRLVRGEVAFDAPKGQTYLLDYAIVGPPLATFSIPAS